MGYGLFGKLPQKRDFVSVDIPWVILHPLENWVQSAVAASRSELGRSWEESYLVAPIWRFWFGHAVFGAGCAGVVMPSVDKVGRFFPLMVVYSWEEGVVSAPPPFDPRDEWFSALEGRILSVLDEEVDTVFEQLLEGLPVPAETVSVPEPDSGMFKGGPIWNGLADETSSDLVKRVVEADYWQVAQARSYWWTAGNGASGPMLHAKAGLPDAYFYTRMLRLAAE